MILGANQKSWDALFFSIGLVFLLAALLTAADIRLGRIAPRAGCAMNLGSICKAISLYRGEFNDVYPRDLSLLVQKKTISAKTLICWQGGRLGYTHCHEPAETSADDDIMTHSSYIYVPLDDNCHGDMCCLFELPINHRQEGSNLATANSVSWLNNDSFLARVQNLNDYLYEERERKNVR